MPPTVQPNANEDRDKRARSGERRSELLCRVKYGNTLPDIPFDPKFITYPFEANRFVEYNATSLERNFKFDLLTEHDLGVPIDLVNPDIYAVDPSAKLAVEDERLLEEDVAALGGGSKRSRHHNKNVSWLRKTEYISTEYSRGMQKSDKVEAKVGFNIKKTFKVEDIYKDRESQLRAIEKTFVAAGVPITEHYSKRGVTPVSVMEVHPDYELWKHPFAQVIFDSDPAPKPETTGEDMSQAMIRGMVDESGEQFVAYFLPTSETTRKRKRDTEKGVSFEEEEDYDYLLAREYNWNVKNKASKGYEEMYFFVLRDGTVYYNELETRVRLTKRRKATAAVSGAKTRLVVRHRELTEQEFATQEMRRRALTEEEDEDDDEGAATAAEAPEGAAGAGEESGSSSSGDEDDEAARDGSGQRKRQSSSASSGNSDNDAGAAVAAADSDDDDSDAKGSGRRRAVAQRGGSGGAASGVGKGGVRRARAAAATTSLRSGEERSGSSDSSSGSESGSGEEDVGKEAGGDDDDGDDEKKIFGSSGSSSSEEEEQQQQDSEEESD